MQKIATYFNILYPVNIYKFIFNIFLILILLKNILLLKSFWGKIQYYRIQYNTKLYQYSFMFSIKLYFNDIRIIAIAKNCCVFQYFIFCKHLKNILDIFIVFNPFKEYLTLILFEEKVFNLNFLLKKNFFMMHSLYSISFILLFNENFSFLSEFSENQYIYIFFY